MGISMKILLFMRDWEGNDPTILGNG